MASNINYLRQTKYDIEKAIDRFEEAVIEGPTNDEYYHQLLNDITIAVANWIDRMDPSTANDEGLVTIDSFKQIWLDEMELRDMSDNRYKEWLAEARKNGQ